MMQNALGMMFTRKDVQTRILAWAIMNVNVMGSMFMQINHETSLNWQPRLPSTTILQQAHTPTTINQQGNTRKRRKRTYQGEKEGEREGEGATMLWQGPRRALAAAGEGGEDERMAWRWRKSKKNEWRRGEDEGEVGFHKTWKQGLCKGTND